MLVSVIFSIIYLYAWYMNGTNNTKFDLPALISAYSWIAGFLGYVHTVNSGLNSKIGEKL